MSYKEKYKTFDEFIKRFPCNPILEYILDKDIMCLIIMHEDIELPFLVEVPFGKQIEDYINKNAV